MIGCIIVGGLVALAVAKIARHHRGYHGGGWGCGPCFSGGGWRRHMCGGPEHWPHDSEGPDGDGGGGWFAGGGLGRKRQAFESGRRYVMRHVLSRLETTPTQNQALRAAADEFRNNIKAAKGEARRSRSDLAAAFRRPAIDAEAMGEMFARHDSELDTARKAFVGMVVKVHDTLDEVQRERLAQLVETGPAWFRRPPTPSW